MFEDTHGTTTDRQKHIQKNNRKKLQTRNGGGANGKNQTEWKKRVTLWEDISKSTNNEETNKQDPQTNLEANNNDMNNNISNLNQANTKDTQKYNVVE